MSSVARCAWVGAIQHLIPIPSRLHNNPGSGSYFIAETLLVKLLTDVFQAFDNDRVTILALCDIIAAFDTIENSILFNRLSISFGMIESQAGLFYGFRSDSFISGLMMRSD